jgi:CubicO group peptidase (beta-lactamase class C family)
MRSLRNITIILLAILATTSPSYAFQSELAETIGHFYERGDTPALGVVIVHKDKVLAQSVIGVRAMGGKEKVTADDRWHIGSMTKAFTAHLIYKLAEEGVLKLSMPIQEFLISDSLERKERQNKITLDDLLSHRSGLERNLRRRHWPSIFAAGSRVDGRAKYVDHIFSLQNRSQGKFHYSNAGYVVAASVAEAITQKPWEELIKTRVLDQLNITGFGFGRPIYGPFNRQLSNSQLFAVADLNQPRGHRLKNGKFIPVGLKARGDNPMVMAPAGGLNMTLSGISKFLIDSLDGIRSEGGVLHPNSYQGMHQPRDSAGDYGAGWTIRDGIHFHNGTNIYWFSEMYLYPKFDIGLSIVLNHGHQKTATKLVDDLLVSLLSKISIHIGRRLPLPTYKEF